MLKNHLSENKCEKINKINKTIEDNKIINYKKSFQNIEQKCINHNIPFDKLEKFIDNYISQNNKF